MMVVMMGMMVVVVVMKMEMMVVMVAMMEVIRMEMMVEDSDNSEDGGDEDDDGDDTCCLSSLIMCQASEYRTLTTLFPPHAHCKVVPFMLTSYFRGEETEAQEGRCDFLQVSQEVAARGWCWACLTTAPPRAGWDRVWRDGYLPESCFWYTRDRGGTAGLAHGRGL